jgi:hypothetical protein
VPELSEWSLLAVLLSVFALLGFGGTGLIKKHCAKPSVSRY